MKCRRSTISLTILIYLCLGTIGMCLYHLNILTTRNYSQIESNISYPITLNEDFILNNVSICPRNRNLTVLFIVHSAADHFERRRNIRSTYGSRTMFLPAEVRVVFLLGIVQNANIQENIQSEHTKYGDSIQGNFLDTYRNLTNKGIMGFKWILQNCQNVKHVIKVDDDVVFDMWRFLENKSEFQSSHSFYCSPISDAVIFREGKWSLSRDQYSGLERWPWTYCQGFVVVMSIDVIIDLFRVAHNTPFLWIDDVYLFGYLAHQVGNITFKNMPKNLNLEPGPVGGQCLSIAKTKCPMLAVGADEKTYKYLWREILRRNNKSLE